MRIRGACAEGHFRKSCLRRGGSRIALNSASGMTRVRRKSKSHSRRGHGAAGWSAFADHDKVGWLARTFAEAALL
jgi:hypothetical protein